MTSRVAIDTTNSLTPDPAPVWVHSIPGGAVFSAASGSVVGSDRAGICQHHVISAGQARPFGTVWRGEHSARSRDVPEPRRQAPLRLAFAPRIFRATPARAATTAEIFARTACADEEGRAKVTLTLRAASPEGSDADSRRSSCLRRRPLFEDQLPECCRSRRSSSSPIAVSGPGSRSPPRSMRPMPS